MEPKMNPERGQVPHASWPNQPHRCCWCAHRPSLWVLQHWLYILNGQGDLSSSFGHATITGRCSDQWRSRRYRERLISWTLANISMISWDASGYIDITLISIINKSIETPNSPLARKLATDLASLSHQMRLKRSQAICRIHVYCYAFVLVLLEFLWFHRFSFSVTSTHVQTLPYSTEGVCLISESTVYGLILSHT